MLHILQSQLEFVFDWLYKEIKKKIKNFTLYIFHRGKMWMITKIKINSTEDTWGIGQYIATKNCPRNSNAASETL